MIKMNKMKQIITKHSSCCLRLETIVYLPDPALLEMELEGELHQHGPEGVGVSHLGHREEYLKLLWKQLNL